MSQNCKKLTVKSGNFSVEFEIFSAEFWGVDAGNEGESVKAKSKEFRKCLMLCRMKDRSSSIGSAMA